MFSFVNAAFCLTKEITTLVRSQVSSELAVCAKFLETSSVLENSLEFRLKLGKHEAFHFTADICTYFPARKRSG
ncbi:hypothetical protein ACROYT_G007422 [Oculina patagonica]